jgi:hypothetical protein
MCGLSSAPDVPAARSTSALVLPSPREVAPTSGASSGAASIARHTVRIDIESLPTGIAMPSATARSLAAFTAS